MYNIKNETSMERQRHSFLARATMTLLLALFTTIGAWATITGSGQPTDPYVLNTAEDWATFANPDNSSTYWGSNVYVKLSDTWDNSTSAVTAMVGTNGTRFCGTFDGNGKTLTLNLTTDGYEFTAPFRYVDGATIKLLHTAGSVSGGNQKYATGLIGRSYGTVTITSCRSSVAISSDRSGLDADATHGGFIGVSEGTVTFTNSLFDGHITDAAATNCGGFVGWRNGTVTFNNCLMAGTMAISSTDGSATFNRNNGENTTLNHCYYKTSYGDVQGTAVGETSNTTLIDNEHLGSGWEISGDNVIPIMNRYNMAFVTVAGLNSKYLYDNGNAIAISYTVTDLGGTQITPATHFNATITKDGETVTSVTATGDYVLTLTGLSPYTGSRTFNFIVGDADLTISSADDWEAFASSVSNGETYRGKYVKLADNFDNSANPITTMVGTNDHKFCGTFYGNGRTLTVNLSATTDNCAPFGYVDGATIQDLTVAGTISTSRKFAASIAAHTSGTTSITHCNSTASITGSISGDGTHGGFVAVNEGSASLNFTNCVFKGKMLGANATSNGGFVGYNGGTEINYTDCLFAPAELTMSATSSSTFNRNGNSELTRCYYTEPLGTAEGTQVFTSVKDFCKRVTFDNIDYYPRSTAVITTPTRYDYNGGSAITVTPAMTYDGEVLDADCYTATITKDGNAVTTVTDKGCYTLILTGNNSKGYCGEMSINFYVMAALSGNGTADEPYRIGDIVDWERFAVNINAGTDADKYYKLTADIDDIETMVGTSDHKFCGTFLGGGHTLTLNLTTDGNDYTAPFRYVNGATIKCLHTAGSVNGGNRKFAAGLIGSSEGTVTVASCRSSAAITSSISGDATHGGFIGTASGTVTFTNCLFDGSITDATATNCGGFVGWRNGSLTFNNCMMAGTMAISSTNGSATFNRNGSSTLNNCYYKTAYGDVQGTQTSATGSDLQALLGSGWQVSGSSVVPIMDSNNLVIATVSGIDSYYIRTGNEIKPVPTVTAADGKVLTEGTDYTVTWSGDGKTDGTYTVTVTGKGSYTGIQSVSYLVSIVPMWLRIDTSKNPGDEGYYYMNMPTNGTYSYEINDGFEESFQVRYSHSYGKETGTITFTTPTGRKMVYSGAWTNGSASSSDCSYSIKEGATTKYSGNNNTTINETTTSGSSLTITCSHNGTCGALTLNVRMKAEPIRVSVEKLYAYTGSVINVNPTVRDADQNKTLTSGTDYDLTFSPTVVRDKGVYSVTVTGKGSYSFTKTYHFLVGTLEYVDENGVTRTKTLDDLTLLTTRDDLPGTLTGWYLVADNVSFSTPPAVSGTAHLILADGTTMNSRIVVNGGNTLNIYGQTAGTGALQATNTPMECAGIGANTTYANYKTYYNDCGTITINGGMITAQGGNYAAGIGGTIWRSGGTVTINGGVVNATGGMNAAAIGGGYYGAGTVIINGGQVTATASTIAEGSNGIGSGHDNSASTISLGWKNATTDFIQASSYNGTVTFTKDFVLDSNHEVIASQNNMNGQKLIPGSGGKWTVVFNSQGGSWVSTQYIENNSTANEPTAPTRTGYTFGGWFTVSDCTDGTAYDFSTPVITALTLYAKWTLTPFTITAPASFEVTVGGSAATTATMGQTVTLTIKSGYTLTGSITVTDANSHTVALTDLGNGSYTFTMPASAVNVVAFAGIIEPGWTFVGTYKTQNFTAADTKYYGFVGTEGTGTELGTFVQVGGYVRVKPMRAYLVAPGGTPKAAPARRAGENAPTTLKVRLIGTDGVTTGIIPLSISPEGEGTEAFPREGLDGVWYTLDGRKLQGEPTQKGLYIHNGKKVIIK
jgi:uncharacterized repeat protein (TIGR02543 family)